MLAFLQLCAPERRSPPAPSAAPRTGESPVVAVQQYWATDNMSQGQRLDECGTNTSSAQCVITASQVGWLTSSCLHAMRTHATLTSCRIVLDTPCASAARIRMSHTAGNQIFFAASTQVGSWHADLACTHRAGVPLGQAGGLVRTFVRLRNRSRRLIARNTVSWCKPGSTDSSTSQATTMLRMLPSTKSSGWCTALCSSMYPNVGASSASVSRRWLQAAQHALAGHHRRRGRRSARSLSRVPITSSHVASRHRTKRDLRKDKNHVPT